MRRPRTSTALTVLWLVVTPSCAWERGQSWPDASHHQLDGGGVDAAGQPDAAVPTDSSVTPDSGVQPDGGVTPDSAVGPDSTVVVDGGGQADSGVQPDGGVVSYGPLLYENVSNIWLTDNLHRVRYHPTGEFALLLGASGTVGRYDAATGAVSFYATLGDQVVDLDVAASGDYFLVVGQATGGGGRLWRISVDAQLQLSHTEEAQITLGDPVAIERSPNNVDWAIGLRSTINISHLQLWADGSGVYHSNSFNTGAGLTDLTWGDPAYYAGSANVIIGAGWNGADSKTWIEATDAVVANAWPLSFGNPGGAGWRPGGSFGLFTAQTTNKLYVFSGAWAMHTLPGVGTAASPNAVAFTADGSRAVVVGRALGSPLTGTVFDYRPGTATSFNIADVQYSPIPSFDAAPYFANSNTHLLGADWRPSSACTEGLIVGSDNGTAWNPTFGLIVRFYDANDPDC